MRLRLAMVFVIGVLSLAMVASAADLPKKYGIELRGGYGMVAMNDVNNITDSLWGGAGATTATKPGGTGTFGISIFYRTDPHFLWEIGYNSLVGGNWISKDAVGHESKLNVNGSEFFVLPTYLINVSDALTLGLAAGPNFSFANASRTGDRSDLNFADASGRTVGGMVKVSGELAMNKNALVVSAGYRNHYVDRIRYEKNDGEKIYVPTGNFSGASNLPIDMSGAFFQVAWRWYFEPKSWKAE